MAAFAYTLLYVQDVMKALEFYEKTFGLERQLTTTENTYAELNTGSIVLAFASIEFAKNNLSADFLPSSPSEKPFGVHLGFFANNVQRAIDNAINNGATLVKAPETRYWGQVVGYFRDLDGFLVEVCTRIIQ